MSHINDFLQASLLPYSLRTLTKLGKYPEKSHFYFLKETDPKKNPQSFLKNELLAALANSLNETFLSDFSTQCTSLSPRQPKSRLQPHLRAEKMELVLVVV